MQRASERTGIHEWMEGEEVPRLRSTVLEDSESKQKKLLTTDPFIGLRIQRQTKGYCIRCQSMMQFRMWSSNVLEHQCSLLCCRRLLLKRPVRPLFFRSDSFLFEMMAWIWPWIRIFCLESGNLSQPDVSREHPESATWLTLKISNEDGWHDVHSSIRSNSMVPRIVLFV